MTSFRKPTDEDVDAVVPRLGSPQHEQYFFDRLENPHWIRPLQERGFFDHPPAPITVEGGGERHPLWPASRYLARMAELAPEDVASILAQVDTNNWVVARDILDAVQAMPAEHAARLAVKIGQLVDREVLWHDLKDVAELIAHLARGGQPEASLELAKTAFALQQFDSMKRPRRRDEHGYIEGLQKDVIPSLIPVHPCEFLALLIQWMKITIESERRTRFNEDDFSYIWRPAIEEHEQNSDYRFPSQLVSCLREAFELAVRDGHLVLAEALELLGQQPYLLFKRLSIHLINVFAERDPERARRTMLDREMLADFRRKHEYACLVGDRFNLLTDEQRAEWLAWIDAGPEAADPNYFGSDDDEDRRRRRREWWTYERLHWVRDQLDGERREFYERMKEKHGEPELADLNAKTGVRWGHESPYTVEQFAAMGFEQAVEMVANWQPESGGRSTGDASVEGLAEVFRRYVAQDAVAASKQASLLQGKSAIYVRAFLRAMDEAVKQALSIELASVLELCRRVVRQPMDDAVAPASDEPDMVDRSWQWSRDGIADLVREVCEAEDGEAPRYDDTHREALWSVIEPLTQDPSESYVVRDLSDVDPRAEEWATLTLNAPRARALLAVLAYAEWMARLNGERPGRERSFSSGLAALPEVQTVLEAHLGGPKDDFTVRAVYGWRFVLLYWLDRNWLAEHIDRIFDLQRIEQDRSTAYGWAAWNTFLLSTRPHIELYRLLRTQFSYAVDQAADVTASGDSMHDPFARLGEHLLMLYGRGDLGEEADAALEADGGIVRRLLTKAVEPVRNSAIQFVGRSLQDHDNQVPQGVLDRFMALWDWYWEATGREDAQGNPESATFGYWFTSGAFDASWSMERLEQFVQAAPQAEPDTLILRRLAEIAETDIARAVRIVGRFVGGDRENWRIHGWQKEAWTILELGLKAGGKTRAEAEQIVDQLGRRGFVEFGDLLAPKDSES